MMQSPTDPDATYREKAGKKYRGYVANVEEAVDSNGSVIVDYQFEQNIYSDSAFQQDRLERMGPQEEGTLYVMDGAYCGEHNTNAASMNCRIRNGIETVLSVLRRKYRVDRMPVHGTRRNRLFFGFKVAAFNVRKLFGYRKEMGHYAPNPLFAE